MTNLTHRFLLLLCLATAPIVADADDRFNGRYDRPVAGNIEWRLGEFRGDRRGYEILYRTPGRNRWQLAPGGAMAVADGWVLGTDRHTGGFGIYRWNGFDWSRMPGAAMRIGGSYRQPWVINDSGTRYSWNGYEWRLDRNDRYDERERDDRRYRHNDRDDNRGRRNNRRWNR